LPFGRFQETGALEVTLPLPGKSVLIEVP